MLLRHDFNICTLVGYLKCPPQILDLLVTCKRIFWYLGETEYIKISTITNQFFLGFTDTGIYHNILM
jgi:hypothetical protein